MNLCQDLDLMKTEKPYISDETDEAVRDFEKNDQMLHGAHVILTSIASVFILNAFVPNILT